MTMCPKLIQIYPNTFYVQATAATGSVAQELKGIDETGLSGKYWSETASEGRRTRSRTRSGNSTTEDNQTPSALGGCHSMPPPPPSQPSVRQRPIKTLTRVKLPDPPPSSPSPPKRLAALKYAENLKKEMGEKEGQVSEKDGEKEKRQQESVLGDIMDAQKSMLQKEPSTAKSQDSKESKDTSEEHHSEDLKRAAEPDKTEQVKRVRRSADEPKPPVATKKHNESWKKQKEEKDKRAAEKDAEEKRGQQGSVLGNIMDAQKTMLKKESRVVNSDAMLQDMLDRYQDYHGEDLRRSADPVRAEELKPPSGNYSYRLWNLRKKGESSGDPVKVLVRAKTHAIVSNRKLDKEYRRSHQTFTLSSRLGEFVFL